MHITEQNKIKGLTLVELMIAMAISAILLVGVGTIYGNSKRTYNVDEQFAQLQENARIAMNYIVQDVRMAGYIGCAWNNEKTETFECYLNNDTFSCDSATVGLDGYDATGTEALATTAAPMKDSNGDGKLDTAANSNWTNNNGNTSTSLTSYFPTGDNAPVANSDIIILRHGAGGGIKLADTQDAAWFTIHDQGFGVPHTPGIDCHEGSGICEDDILIVSDCEKARVFQASGLTHLSSKNQVKINHDTGTAPGNNPPQWGAATDKQNRFDIEDSEILKYGTYAYYVGNSTRNNEPVLYRHNGIKDKASVELVEGIENLQILYGVDDDNNGVADRYTSANSINFADKAKPIVSVRISMLVRSKEDVVAGGDKEVTYKLASAPIKTIKDRRLRKMFTTTIKVRNKGI